VIGIVIVRAGTLNGGAPDVAAASDEVWLIGDGVDRAGEPPGTSRAYELGNFAPSAWAAWLDEMAGPESVVFAAEPDGRDLAARLAARRGDPLLAGCVEIRSSDAVLARAGGATTEIVAVSGRVVVTVQPRHRGVVDAPLTIPITTVTLPGDGDVLSLAVLAPEGVAADLADAKAIFAGGAGLSDADDFVTLGEVAAACTAAMGATRVVTDRGWAPADRQIGTTGVTVTPALYVAFGVSGAVQHTAGLGSPDHVISVNIDPACPMSQMADLALVADAHATLAALSTLVTT
jgi:electron transfer flavoprotein alpha subunit